MHKSVGHKLIEDIEQRLENSDYSEGTTPRFDSHKPKSIKNSQKSMIDDIDECIYKLKSEYKQMEKSSKQKNE